MMGASNEVLRQLVGKTSLLGLGAVDLWYIMELSLFPAASFLFLFLLLLLLLLFMLLLFFLFIFMLVCCCCCCSSSSSSFPSVSLTSSSPSSVNLQSLLLFLKNNVFVSHWLLGWRFLTDAFLIPRLGSWAVKRRETWHVNFLLKQTMMTQFQITIDKTLTKIQSLKTRSTPSLPQCWSL